MPKFKLRNANVQLSAEATSLQALQDIRANRAEIISRIDAAARHGQVPDGLIWALIQNHMADLAERRRLWVALETALDGHLHRLNAQFQPAPPEVEKPRARSFGALSADLKQARK